MQRAELEVAREQDSILIRLFGEWKLENEHPWPLIPGIFFDELSAGIDPVSARLLDTLIRELRGSLGATLSS